MKYACLLQDRGFELRTADSVEKGSAYVSRSRGPPGVPAVGTEVTTRWLNISVPATHLAAFILIDFKRFANKQEWRFLFPSVCFPLFTEGP